MGLSASLGPPKAGNKRDGVSQHTITFRPAPASNRRGVCIPTVQPVPSELTASFKKEQ